jgi:PEP-CTERM motif
MLAIYCAACLWSLSGSVSATVISVGSFASSLTGLPENETGSPGSCSLGNSCLKQTYDTTGNLAYVGSTGTAAVASSVLASHDPFHDETGINDGSYGNGSSWIGNTPNSWLKIDLGVAAIIDQILFGRYRMGTCCNDRQAGSFSIAAALTDNVFSNGDTTNDDLEYSTIVPTNSVSYPSGQTVKVDFTTGTPEIITARYLKLTFANSGTAIDEVEVFGTTVPAPATLALFGLGLAGLGWSRRKQYS